MGQLISLNIQITDGENNIEKFDHIINVYAYASFIVECVK